ncbi:MAG TPA: electron transport complex subunit E [Petrotogaceae bacterium]|mgnify:FL=1|jgi:electron transport complex protein RnfE|nr:electron transport complex subunit E [Petrotogaceae bacterium]HPO27996.1 electron transport complex subunit E [Petrotogaceae bacterium]
MADIKNLTKGLIKENPLFIQVLGTCPALATTTNAKNALGMGIAVIAVLVLSNIVISVIRKMVPNKIRIPIFIVVIASFVTMIDLLMHAFTYDLWKVLGIFIPLIVVNCVLMGRAEAFASKNGVIDSILDGIGMGGGYALALFIMGSIREILGNGSWLGLSILPQAFKMYIFILPPGAFITFGILIAVINAINLRKEKIEKEKKKAGETK